MAVDGDAASVDVVEAKEEPRKGRLARTGPADDRDRLTWFDLKVEVFEDRWVLAVVEGDILEADSAVDVLEVHGTGSLDDVRPFVEDLEDAIGARGGALAEHHKHAEHHERRLEHEQVGVEGQDGADAQVAIDHHCSAEEQDQHQPELGEILDNRREAGPQVCILDVGP